jgi:hypothetical protein
MNEKTGHIFSTKADTFARRPSKPDIYFPTMSWTPVRTGSLNIVLQPCNISSTEVDNIIWWHRGNLKNLSAWARHYCIVLVDQNKINPLTLDTCAEEIEKFLFANEYLPGYLCRNLDADDIFWFSNWDIGLVDWLTE